MKKSNKKGFTIVELVIVIAVIAILAAVLIPTFASIVKKANLSADQQAVRQMNTVLVAETSVKNIDAATKALSDAGYNADKTLVPVTKNHSFYWYETYNTVLLINEDGEKFELVYPTDNKDIVDSYQAESNRSKLHNLALARTKTEVMSKDLGATLKAGNNVVLKEDFTFEGMAPKVPVGAKEVNAALVVPAGKTVNMDLGGKTIATENNKSYALAVAGNVVIDNGTISSRGIYVAPGGTLTLGENVEVVATGTDGGSAIRNYGGVVIVNGGKYYSNNAQTLADITDDTVEFQPLALYSDGGYVEINGESCFYSKDPSDESSSATMSYVIKVRNTSVVINDCTVEAGRGALAFLNSNVIINDGTFTNNDNGAYALYVEGNGINSSLTIKGGTFNNTAEGGADACITGIPDDNLDLGNVLAAAADNKYNAK